MSERHKDIRRIVWELGGVILLSFFMQLLEFHGWMAGPEGKFLDLLLWINPISKHDAPPMVALEIDDEGYQNCFGYSPMDPDMIRQIVQWVLLADPKVVGVDIITDSPDPADFEQYTKLRDLPGSRNIVWAAGVKNSSLDESQSFWVWLTGPHPIAVQPTQVLGQEVNQATDDPKVEWAIPLYPREEDLHLRRFPEHVIVSPVGLKWSWPSMIAEVAYPTGRHPGQEGNEEVLVALTPRTLRHYKLSDLFTCDNQPRGRRNLKEKTPSEDPQMFKKDASGTIVLIGGTFQSGRDTYQTSQGRISGLEMNANAVAGDLAGTVVSEVQPICAFLADILFGFVVGFALHFAVEKTQRFRVVVVILGLLLFFVIVLEVTLYHLLKQLWFSFIGMAIGCVLDLLLLLWKRDARIRKERRA